MCLPKQTKWAQALPFPTLNFFNTQNSMFFEQKKFKRIKTGGFGWVGVGRSKEHVN
jgi:hypothetical protein